MPWTNILRVTGLRLLPQRRSSWHRRQVPDPKGPHLRPYRVELANSRDVNRGYKSHDQVLLAGFGLGASSLGGSAGAGGGKATTSYLVPCGQPDVEGQELGGTRGKEQGKAGAAEKPVNVTPCHGIVRRARHSVRPMGVALFLMTCFRTNAGSFAVRTGWT